MAYSPSGCCGIGLRVHADLSNAQAANVLHHVVYEWTMIADLQVVFKLRRFPDGELQKRSYLESLLIHLRNLSNFACGFETSRAKKVMGAEKPISTSAVKCEFKKLKDAIEDRIAHANFIERCKYDDEADWDLDPLIRELEQFMKNLHGAMSRETMEAFRADDRNRNLRVPSIQ